MLDRFVPSDAALCTPADMCAHADAASPLWHSHAAMTVIDDYFALSPRSSGSDKMCRSQSNSDSSSSSSECSNSVLLDRRVYFSSEPVAAVHFNPLIGSRPCPPRGTSRRCASDAPAEAATSPLSSNAAPTGDAPTTVAARSAKRRLVTRAAASGRGDSGAPALSPPLFEEASSRVRAYILRRYVVP